MSENRNKQDYPHEEVRTAELTKPPVIGPGHTFSSVTDKIASIALSRRTPTGWFIGFGLAFMAGDDAVLHDRLPRRERRRHLGHKHPGRVGLRHPELRLVDRHRPRGHADLGDPAAAQAGMADLDQQVRGSDDALRGRLRGVVPAASHGQAVARLLALSLPEHHAADGRSSAAL